MNFLPAGAVVTAVGVDTALSEVVERFIRYAGGLAISRNCGMYECSGVSFVATRDASAFFAAISLLKCTQPCISGVCHICHNPYRLRELVCLQYACSSAYVKLLCLSAVLLLGKTRIHPLLSHHSIVMATCYISLRAANHASVTIVRLAK